MPNGTGKWFNNSKGYGFIVPDEGGNDIFVHIRVLESSGLETLNEGQKIRFEKAENNGRISAVNVEAI